MSVEQTTQEIAAFFGRIHQSQERARREKEAARVAALPRRISEEEFSPAARQQLSELRASRDHWEKLVKENITTWGQETWEKSHLREVEEKIQFIECAERARIRVAENNAN